MKQCVLLFQTCALSVVAGKFRRAGSWNHQP